jgi:hypothetical protein
VGLIAAIDPPGPDVASIPAAAQDARTSACATLSVGWIGAARPAMRSPGLVKSGGGRVGGDGSKERRASAGLGDTGTPRLKSMFRDDPSWREERQRRLLATGR